MPRTKYAPTSPPAPAASAPAPAVERDANSPNERLAQLLAQFNGGSEFRVYVERIESNGERTYMGTLVLAETLFDDVRARWGGGRFTGRVVGPNTKYAGTVPPFRIDGPAKLEEAPTAAAGVPANAPPSRTEQLIVDTLATMGKAIEQLAQRQAAQMDPTEQLVKLAGVLNTVSPRNAGGGADPSDTVALIRELMGLQRELAEDRPPAPASSAFGVALESAVKPLVGVLNRKMALEEAKVAARRPLPPGPAQNGAPAPAPIASGSGNGNSATHSNNTVDVSTDPLVNLIRSIPMPARYFLLSCAADDNDPADYATVVLDRLTEDAYEEIQKQLPRTDFVAVLVREIPMFGQYPEWFGRLTDELRASLELTSRGGLEAEGGPGEGTAAHSVDSLDLERDV